MTSGEYPSVQNIEDSRCLRDRSECRTCAVPYPACPGTGFNHRLRRTASCAGTAQEARFIWNLCVEQEAQWRPGRGPMPRFAERCRQLSEARAENPWLAEGSVIVQQQAIRDHAQAMAGFFARTHHRPSWRKAGRDEGFRIVQVRPGDVRRLNRKTAQVRIPKAGWVRFRWSRPVPPDVKSYRVTMDRAGRWHVAFAVIPGPVPAPGNGEVVGVDRGVAVSAALSTGELLRCPALTARQRQRRRQLERKLTRSRRGSGRRGRVRLAIARLRACEADRRKDWCEKTSTGLARRFDAIRVEHLKIAVMTRSARGTTEVPGRHVRHKAGLNRGIWLAGGACWSAAWRTRLPAGSRRCVLRTRASAARRAGTSQRAAARAKPCSAAWPADTPATLT
jgi:putative transposase